MSFKSINITKLLCLLGCIICSTEIIASVLLISNNNHFAIVHRIEAALFSHPAPRPRISYALVDQLQKSSVPEITPDAKLVVTFGAEALELLLKSNTQTPILATLIRKSTFHQLMSQYQRVLNDETAPISAIFLDHPLQRQLNLIQALFPEVVTKGSIGVLFGPGSIFQQEELLSLAKENQLRLNTIYVNNFENPVAVMDAFLDEVRVLLALPDNRIFNPHSARGILLTAFHKQVPLIGYSQSYVKNGALVSLFSTTKQIAQHTALTILDILEQKKLPAPQHPKEFVIEINYQVARSLNIELDSETTLQKQLIMKEISQQTHTKEINHRA